MNFKIEKKLKNSLGRAGVLETPHGVIHTPAFVPVGTKATVKSLTPEQVRELGAEVILANTYHLYLQPGEELVAKAGGLHKFMNWPGPIITDSGGFQVFSLGAAYGKQVSKVSPPAKGETQRGSIQPEGVGTLVKISEDGVSFKSHLDGSVHYITPEKAVQIQHALGADIIFAFDECTSPAEDLQYQEEALERTHRWAERCLEEHKKLTSPHPSPGQERVPKAGEVAIFGIVQGGRDENLRKKSAKVISEMRVDPAPYQAEGFGSGFDGFGIGGSFDKVDMGSAVKWVNEILPEDKPRHLLGIGEPEDLFMGVENGVDLFDCVAPTRIARNGALYTKNGKINITNAKFKDDFSKIEDDCQCYTCANFTRAYISHLFKGKEMLAATLASAHNLYFIVNLVKQIRQSILDDEFFDFKKEFLYTYTRLDEN